MSTGSIPQSLCDLLPNSMNFSRFENEILEGMIDQNVVGHGGLGTVYRIDLHNGEIVAVKQINTRDESSFDHDHDIEMVNREVTAEVEIYRKYKALEYREVVFLHFEFGFQLVGI
ncbi:Protein kinase domain [Artemisia annua]|uniref:Protein kinase domain n=1 Tax=Artemisia annua TaxID=35608 RepID=A0A2U1KMY9_ARTAN|nr:Protein kinase domain [Artemisia annua]